MGTGLAMLRTALALGLPNIARVVVYRMGIRLGIHPVLKVAAHLPTGPFYAKPLHACDLSAPPVTGQLVSFGWHARDYAGRPPDWHSNSITGKRITNAKLPWWRISDFSSSAGDIKTVWEASRMGWVIPLAQRASTGEQAALDKLNTWLTDWCENNPAYLGPNWKCGQETSLRLLHLWAGALVLDQAESSLPGLLDLAEACLKRIEPTRSYAVAQDNNHGISEASALFIGGSWLACNGRPGGDHWAEQGRRLLENRVSRLIAADGTFSQYSVVYHRLMLDAVSFAELWRRRLDLPRFSPGFYERCALATRWLHSLVDPRTGDAPNIGANDGALVLDFAQAGYRDFRPSVQFASALFLDRKAYDKGESWDNGLRWLAVKAPTETLTAPASIIFDDGGFAVLRQSLALAVLRYPRFRFRPGQADALHLDLTVDGINHLRDGGTYSYNDGPEWISYFGGARSHNTVMFDDHEQMQRFGRFLYGDWLKTDAVVPLVETATSSSFGASYHNGSGSHVRTIELTGERVTVVDKLSGFLRSAVLRWRLAPGDWVIDGHTITCGGNRLEILSDAPIARFQLVEGWESRYYLQRSSLPVLEIEIESPGTLTTTYSWIR